jgi:hypothetical protein
MRKCFNVHGCAGARSANVRIVASWPGLCAPRGSQMACLLMSRQLWSQSRQVFAQRRICSSFPNASQLCAQASQICAQAVQIAACCGEWRSKELAVVWHISAQSSNNARCAGATCIPPFFGCSTVPSRDRRNGSADRSRRIAAASSHPWSCSAYLVPPRLLRLSVAKRSGRSGQEGEGAGELATIRHSPTFFCNRPSVLDFCSNHFTLCVGPCVRLCCAFA